MRIPAIRAAVVAVVAALAACDSPTAPRLDAISGSASLTTIPGRKITCPGKSGGVCDMDVSVVMSASGNARLIVRTGGYDQATGEHDPNGTFEKIQYKIYNEKGKLVSTKNDDASGTVYTTSLPGTFKPEYRVEVQANIRSHSGKKGTAVVRGVGTPAYLPDIDLSAETIELVVSGARQPLAPVAAGASNTYIVDFANLTTVGGTASTTGIRTMCVVSVDGAPQVPGFTPGFAYVGSPYQYIGPGLTATCSFTLSLAAGQHTVKVTALAVDIFADNNPSNNSTTAQVTAALPADVAVTSLSRLENGAPVALGEVVAGTTHAFRATVSSPANSLNAAVACSVLINGAPAPADRIQWTRDAFALAAGASDACEFSLSFPVAGSFNLQVVATAPGDPNVANNSAAGAITVRPAASPDITTDLVIRSVAPIAPVLSGADVEYVAKIGVNPGGTFSTPDFVCAVSVVRTSGQPSTATVLWAKQNGGATENVDDECRFRLIGLTANGGADDTYRITVTANATNANELPGTGADNNRVVDQLVRAITVDLDVIRIERSNPVPSLPWVPLDSVVAGPTFTYRAFIGTIAGAAAVNSASFTCTATVSAPGFPTQTIPGAVAGPATLAGTATCSFPLALQGDGNDDRDYDITVTATPVGATELAPADNAEPFAQKAIVRADIGVLVDRVILTVDGGAHPCNTVSGLCSLVKSDTISVGKTGNFTAFLHNYSADRAASVSCQVTAGAPGTAQSPIAATPAQVQIGAGGEVSCAFSYAFDQRVAVDFTVIATALSPLDNQRANDTVRFTMAPVQNIVFPNLQFAQADIVERGLVVNGEVTELYKQQAALSRVFIAFTNKTAVIGDFTFTGKVFTNGTTTPFSEAVFRVNGLQPGGLNAARNCVGIGGPGAAMLSSTGPNDAFIDMQICAEESPADPTIQMISVTYNAEMEGMHTGSSLPNFGPTITFDLKLQWVLAGNLPSQVSTATGRLMFDLVNENLGGGAYFKHQTGSVTILP